MLPVALTIAGSDPSGGAGLQADLKTFHQFGVYGAAVVSLLTVQNTRGVTDVRPLDAAFVRAQLEAVLHDMPPHAVKTGALGTAALVMEVGLRVRRLEAPVVVDPVMISKHGAPLLDPEAMDAVRRTLVPSAFLVTPNAPEAEALTGRAVTDAASARAAAQEIVRMGARAALVKGGHLEGDAVDVLFVDGEAHELRAARIETHAGHGTGCAYAAAITALLARGVGLVPAVHHAKRWLTEALRNAPELGQGVGPIDHFSPPRVG